ncbi:hypothetical protein E0485_11215 [Paenibacillus albiflavus]|uniref:DUF3679 domain-containing protein n=1 Tax=Paenibacillus albiflavus TaxID=2545760 RepID=A0A4R4ECX4_9BACL|nr:hypothetical protein [Paenibacillus albiflavus]TCZ77033.1 hypothetical protein E0485_11215 [Paenibacillus albiflavus]
MSRMGKFYLKIGLAIIFTVFCILFGLSLASSGVQQVYGPMNKEQIVKDAAAKKKQQEDELAAQKRKESTEMKAKEEKLSYEQIQKMRNQTEQTSLFGSIGNSIGNMLKKVAQLIVSLFSGLFDIFV